MKSTRIKVALDCRQIQAQNEGMGRAALELVRVLRNHYEMHLLASSRLNRIKELQNINHFRWHTAGPASMRLSFLWENIVLPRLLKNIRPDIYHAPFNVGVPFLKLSGTKYVVTIHDLIPLSYPASLRPVRRINWYLSTKIAFKNADHIITDSGFSKKQLVEWYPKAESKISVVPLFLSDNFFDKRHEKGIIDAVKLKYHIQGTYLIYHGGFRPNKNVPKLISAYEAYRRQSNDRDKLCLIGSHSFDFNRYALDSINRSPFRNDIITTGYVPDDDLSYLLSGAKCMVYLSRMEGFGYAPLEAVACGTPVVCAKNSSLPEILDSHALWISDNAAAMDIASEIIRLMSDTALRETLVQGGLIHSKRYTRDRFQQNMEKVYHDILPH